MRPDLAPKGVGRILDASLAVLRSHWRSVLGAAAIVLFPMAAVLGTLQSFYTRGFFELIPLMEGAGPEPPRELMNLTALSGVQYAASMAYMLVSAFFSVALMTSLPALLHGRVMRPMELLKGGWRRLLWYVLAVVVVYAVLGAAAFAGVVAAVFTVGIGLIVAIPAVAWLAARLSVTTMVAVAEEANPFAAVKRSWGLTSRNVWRIVGFYIAVAILVQVLAAAVSSPAVIRQVVDVVANAPADDPFAALTRPVAPGWKLMEGLLYGAGVTLSAVFGQVAWYLLYLDLRARRDGMDLVMRAEALREGV